MRLLLLIVLLATAQWFFCADHAVHAYNPHNLHQALPVTAVDGLGI